MNRCRYYRFNTIDRGELQLLVLKKIKGNSTFVLITWKTGVADVFVELIEAHSGGRGKPRILIKAPDRCSAYSVHRLLPIPTRYFEKPHAPTLRPAEELAERNHQRPCHVGIDPRYQPLVQVVN